MVLVRDVEQTICGNYESYEAFVQAFGSAEKQSRLNNSLSNLTNSMVLIGGTSLSEKGSDRTPPSMK